MKKGKDLIVALSKGIIKDNPTIPKTNKGHLLFSNINTSFYRLAHFSNGRNSTKLLPNILNLKKSYRKNIINSFLLTILIIGNKEGNAHTKHVTIKKLIFYKRL